MTRACSRCGAILGHPPVTIIIDDQPRPEVSVAQEVTWFCSKPHALEYLEQDILDDAKEAQRE
jgi:hypothetical protein